MAAFCTAHQLKNFECEEYLSHWLSGLVLSFIFTSVVLAALAHVEHCPPQSILTLKIAIQFVVGGMIGRHDNQLRQRS